MGMAISHIPYVHNFLHRYEDFQFVCFQKVILKAKIHTTQLMTTIIIIIIGKCYSEPSRCSLSHCLQSGSRTDRGDGVWRYFCAMDWIC